MEAGRDALWEAPQTSDDKKLHTSFAWRDVSFHNARKCKKIQQLEALYTQIRVLHPTLVRAQMMGVGWRRVVRKLIFTKRFPFMN
jgi:hypothetical protein